MRISAEGLVFFSQLFKGIGMSVLLSDLVRDLKLTVAAVKDAEARRKEAETRLTDGLALIGKPLSVGGCVIIGDLMLKKPYATLPMELTPITNLPVDSVIVADTVEVYEADSFRSDSC